MSSESDPSLPADYVRWQDRLAKEYFEGRRDQPVVMFVDRDELQELADEGEDGLRSLAHAVRQLVGINRAASMFARVVRAQALWNHGDRITPPPTLPVLALSVLAASEMRRDESGASHNYYIRLSRALLPDGSDEEIDNLRYYLRERGAFTHVVEMWVRLHSWITERAGECGISTIPENPALSRIGYPLSQALVRRSDRAALTRFFDRMNLKGAGVPGPDALHRLLTVWTRHRSQGLSDHFVEVLVDPAYDDYLKPLIHDLAVAWDGKVITAEGLRRLEIRLVLELDQGEAWWVIPSVSDAPSDILAGSIDGEEFSALVMPDAHSSMLQTEGLPPVTPSALASGFTAKGSACVAEFQPADLFVLIDSAHAGGWTSVDALQAYEEHVLVAAPDMTHAVEQVLSLAADDGWRRLPNELAGQLLEGYTIYFGAIFSDKDALERALEALPGTVAAQIRLGATARPRLLNGLPLFRNLSRNTYLAGGEPDLELPVGAEPRDVLVVLDGARSQTFRASMFPIPFSRFGPYEAGNHTIEADDVTLTFVVHEGVGEDWEPPGIGSLSWRRDQLTSTTDDADVCGAMTPRHKTPDVVLARRGAIQNWLVDRTGRASPLSEPDQPTYLPSSSFMYFELPRDRAAWLLQQRVQGWYAVRLHAAEPAFQQLTDNDRAVWAQAAVAVQIDDPMWQMYVRAWERVCGR